MRRSRQSCGRLFGIVTLIVRAGLQQKPGYDGQSPRRRYTRPDALYDDLGENRPLTRWTHTPIE